MGKDELKACPIHKGECLTHWNIIKHDHDLFQGECRTDCGLVYLTAHKDFYEDAKRSLFSVWNTRPNDAKWVSVEDELPKEEGYYLVAFNYGTGQMPYAVNPTRYWNGTIFVTMATVKHWMPLPEPPEEMEMNDE